MRRVGKWHGNGWRGITVSFRPPLVTPQKKRLGKTIPNIYITERFYISKNWRKLINVYCVTRNLEDTVIRIHYIFIYWFPSIFAFMKPISNIHICNRFSKTLLLRCHKGGLKDTVIPLLPFPRHSTHKTTSFYVIRRRLRKIRRRLRNSTSFYEFP